jgi:hypothetical protein
MPPADNDPMNTEMRVRRALGLDAGTPRATQHHTDTARPRRRFVQDGEVPVVVVHSERKSDGFAPLGSRVAELETALEAERTTRAAVTRSLEEARLTVQSLQTRLTHAELAFAEAIAAEQQARAEAERALQQIVARSPAVVPVKADPVDTPPTGKPMATAPEARKAKAGRKAKPATKAKQARSKLVKWWAPEFRARKPVS